jgi:hypothetical protein
MNAKEFAQSLKTQIETLKNEGVDSLGSDNLITYLSGYIENNSDADIELHKASLQKWVEEHKHFHSQRIELFKSVIQAGQSALKTAFLMNGGASLALLTFIGHLSKSPITQGKVPALAESLSTFVLGVIISALATGTTYLSQWFFHGYSSPHQKTGFALNVLAILLGLLSYIIFAIGSYRSYRFFLTFSA